MSHEAAAYLIAYDIADPRRLGRVRRLLTGRALWVQYSVFVGRFSLREVGALVAELRERINRREDDVRIYRLPLFCRPVAIGASLWPEGLLLGGLDPAPLAEVTKAMTTASWTTRKVATSAATSDATIGSRAEPSKPAP